MLQISLAIFTDFVLVMICSPEFCFNTPHSLSADESGWGQNDRDYPQTEQGEA